MINKWLYKRKLKKYFSKESTWSYKLHHQSTINTFTGKEPPSVVMDSFEVVTKCGSVETLIMVLTKYLDALGSFSNVPKFPNVSRDKGGITLTNYLTKKDGYPYLISISDKELSELLIIASSVLGNLYDTDDTHYSYYSRMLKPYITEALDFRELIHEITQL
jgi:hypothetical protein